MNRKPGHEDRLLAETFHDEWEHGPAARFARTAARAARVRRRLRSSARIAAIGAGVAAVLALAVNRLSPPAMPPSSSSAVPRQIAAQPRAAATAGYEIISDQELLAQLEGEPLLVVRKENGTRDIVLLEPESAKPVSLE